MSVPEGLEGLPWELPRNFLGLDETQGAFDGASVVILPVPYESTTSYGGGAALGPGAILEASRYLELYDHELDAEPYRVGVATLPSLSLTRAGAEAAMVELRTAYDRLLDRGGERLIMMLGGEHSITSAPVRAWADRLEGRLSVLQIDAHTDLRPEYEGTGFSHASVMARVMEQVDITAVGIRALTHGERELIRRREDIHVFFADDIDGGDAWIDAVLDTLGEAVYLTFDVDGLDPTLVPATGTPEPGGLTWYPTLRLLRRLFAEKRVVAVDIVELAPIAGMRAPDFLVAKLAYKMIGYWARGQGRT